MRRRSWNRNQSVAGPTRVLSPSPTRRARSPRRDTHVEVCGAVLSDAGSTPAASTTRATRRAMWCRRRSQPRRSGPSGLALGVNSLQLGYSPSLRSARIRAPSGRHRFARLGSGRLQGAIASLGSDQAASRRHRFARGAPRATIAPLGHSAHTTGTCHQSHHHPASSLLPCLWRRRSGVQRQHRARAHLHAVQEVRRGVERRAERAAPGVVFGPAVRRLALKARRRGL